MATIANTIQRWPRLNTNENDAVPVSRDVATVVLHDGEVTCNSPVEAETWRSGGSAIRTGSESSSNPLTGDQYVFEGLNLPTRFRKILSCYLIEQSPGFNTNSRFDWIAMSESTVKSYLAEHPKMTGVLFTMMLLLTQAGGAVAAAGSANCGP